MEAVSLVYLRPTEHALGEKPGPSAGLHRLYTIVSLGQHGTGPQGGRSARVQAIHNKIMQIQGCWGTLTECAQEHTTPVMQPEKMQQAVWLKLIGSNWPAFSLSGLATSSFPGGCNLDVLGRG